MNKKAKTDKYPRQSSGAPSSSWASSPSPKSPLISPSESSNSSNMKSPPRLKSKPTSGLREDAASNSLSSGDDQSDKRVPEPSKSIKKKPVSAIGAGNFEDSDSEDDRSQGLKIVAMMINKKN